MRYTSDEHQYHADSSSANTPTLKEEREEIAIIGMSGMFPGSANLESFWKNISQAVDIKQQAPKRDHDLPSAGFLLEGIDQFDARFFNISPNEAELMDPQQRLLILTVWRAMEDAGYTAEALAAVKTGVFVGVSSRDYDVLLQAAKVKSPYVPTGNTHSILANRISYLLNLSGPSEAIDTAISSSLVALHQAVTALKTGDCDVAIVGGVNAVLDLSLHPESSGEGIGAILLKPLSKAKADGDKIEGIIKSSAINYGKKFLINNILRAYQRAEVAVESISYVETNSGDPDEIDGLKNAFSQLQKESRQGYCALGTLNTQIGNLEAATGIAELIKVVLAMKHHQLPCELNQTFNLDNSPFYIVEKTAEWKSASPRRAGINVYGMGGMNVYIVLEEAPPNEIIDHVDKASYLLTLSAKSEDALNQKMLDLDNWLSKNPKANLEEISYSLNAGRDHFVKRCAIVASNIDQLRKALKEKQENVFINTNKLTKTTEQQNNLKALTKALQEHKYSADDYQQRLIELASFYVQGYSMDWQLLHAGEAKHKITVPGYPFAKKQFWFEPSAHVALPATTEQKMQKVDERASSIDAWLTKKMIQLLRVETINPTGNWFELGFDSIVATKVVNELRQMLEQEIDITPRDMFAHHSIESFSEYISTLTRTPKAEKKELTLMTETSFPLSLQELEIYEYLLSKRDHTPYHIPMTLKIEKIDVERLRKALNAVIQQHDLLRASYENCDGKIMHHIVDDCIAEINLVKFLNEKHLLNQLQKNISNTFVLSKPPLLRCMIIKKSDHETILQFVLHHLISDGWTVEQFLTDVAWHYNHPNEVQGKSIQYVDYVNWQWTSIYPNFEKRDLPYWRNYLQGYHFQDLVTNKQTKIRPASGDKIKTVIEKELLDHLMQASKKYAITLNSLLLAGLFKMISRFTQRQDVAVVILFSGRENNDYGTTYGDTSNDVILRYQVNENRELNELAKNLQTELLNISEYQGIRLSTLQENNLEIPMISFDFLKISQEPVFFDHDKVEFISVPSDKIGLWGNNPRHLSFKLHLYGDEDLRLELKFRKDKYTKQEVNNIVDAYLSELKQLSLDL